MRLCVLSCFSYGTGNEKGVNFSDSKKKSLMLNILS